MRMGRYVVRKGRFVHENDSVRSIRGMARAMVVGVIIWYFILVGIGVIPFWPFVYEGGVS